MFPRLLMVLITRAGDCFLMWLRWLHFTLMAFFVRRVDIIKVDTVSIANHHRSRFLRRLVFTEDSRHFGGPMLVLRMTNHVPVIRMLHLFFRSYFGGLVVRDSIIFFRVLRMIRSRTDGRFRTFRRALI